MASPGFNAHQSAHQSAQRAAHQASQQAHQASLRASADAARHSAYAASQAGRFHRQHRYHGGPPVRAGGGIVGRIVRFIVGTVVSGLAVGILLTVATAGEPDLISELVSVVRSRF